MSFFIAYVATTIIFLAIDTIWLTIMGDRFYRAQLGDLMLKDIKLHVAGLFYMFYTVGVVVFAINPALSANNALLALGYGALFGFLAYGTYDFTNMATLKDWPTKMSIVDIIWGTAVTGVAATVGFYITRYFS